MAKRRARNPKPRPRGRTGLSFVLPVLEQRHYDLIGLGLVAFAAFFACVFYLGWDGGKVGHGMAQAARCSFSAVSAMRRRC